MNARHRIRLAGPWKAEVLYSSSHRELDGSHLNAVLGPVDQQMAPPFHGQLILQRNFNLPTGLDEHSVVWLCVEGLAPYTRCEIFLNGQSLGWTGSTAAAAGRKEFAANDALENFNRFEIVLTCHETLAPAHIALDASGVIVHASVWMEIEQP